MIETPDIAFVRHLMAVCDVSQTALAQRAGVDPSQLSKLLNGKNKSGRLAPKTMDKLKVYAQSLGNNPEASPEPASHSEAPESVNARDAAALSRLYISLEEPERDLTFDIVEAAVKGSLRRRYGTK
jgi:transcriptional regulator with XRE-family HTH domain